MFGSVGSLFQPPRSINTPNLDPIMHHLWTIPELLDEVLNELPEGNLPNMARVCRAFWAPAARLIWQTVPCFSYLLVLFPEERQQVYRLDSAEFLALSGEPRRYEWERFRLYAHFVKELSMTMDEVNFVTLQQLQTSSKGAKLLPNLRVLSLNIATSPPPHQIAQACKLLLCPTLTTLGCRYIHQSPKQDETMLQLTDCLQSAPHLEEYRWEATETSRAGISRLFAVLPCFPKLRSIDLVVNGLTTELVQPAAQIRKLESARFAFLTNPEGSLASEGVLFPSLKEMICIGFKSAVHTLLLSIRTPVLETLSLDLYSWWGEDDTDTFAGLGNPTNFPFLTTLNVGGLITSWNELTPLLSFKGIKELNMDPTFTTDEEGPWSPSTVRLVAESFPHLEVIILGDRRTPLTNMVLTLPALDCFSQYCPRLQYLAVSVDARRLHTLTTDITPHPAVQEVNLLRSEADTHEVEIAEVISRLWPNLRKGSTIWEHSGNEWPAPRWVCFD